MDDNRKKYRWPRSARTTVAVETPRREATSRTDLPARRRRLTRSTPRLSSFGGRPMRAPRRLAAATPALVRAFAGELRLCRFRGAVLSPALSGFAQVPAGSCAR